VGGGDVLVSVKLEIVGSLGGLLDVGWWCCEVGCDFVVGRAERTVAWRELRLWSRANRYAMWLYPSLAEREVLWQGVVDAFGIHTSFDFYTNPVRA
jgi:hypothetical protein